MTPDLLADTARLVDVASVSHHEGALAGLVESELRAHPGLDVVRIGDNVIARTDRGGNERVVLAGHLDTVPPAGNERAILEKDLCRGLGSADMKGGLAILLRLAAHASRARRELTFVFYAREEVKHSESGLLEIASREPELLRGDAAVLLEPTSARIEAGCQGVVRIEIVVGGRRAHSARPWVGVNAVHRLAPMLERIANVPERRPVIDGCEYRETLQAVSVQGGIAGNVIPDEVRLVVSHRFAPDRDANAALAGLRVLLEPVLLSEFGDRIEVVDQARAAPPSLGHPLLAALVKASDREPVAKVAWTDVAFFAEHGIPAANFGPGDPLLAHRADEFVTRADLEDSYRTLQAVLFES